MIGLGLNSFDGSAQLGGIKIKNPINGGGNNTESTTTTTGSTDDKATVSNPGWYQVSAPTVVLSNDYGFSTSKTSFEPGENIFLRFAFPKSVGETFKETMGFSDIPSTGKISIAISKNIDSDPIVVFVTDIYTSRYTKDNVIDFSLQTDQATLDKIGKGEGDVAQKVGFNSQGTMSNGGLYNEWLRSSAILPMGAQDWEIFLLFSPWGDNDPEKIKLVTQSKFKFTITPENNATLSVNKTADNGITNDLHKANIGKIVFSKTEILKDATSSAQFANSFTMGDDIYARIYLSRSMTNEAGAIGDYVAQNFRYRITIDGNAQTTPVSAGGNYLISGDEETYSKWTTFQIGIAPKQVDVSYYPRNEVNVMFSRLYKLPAGSHTVKIEAVFEGHDRERIIGSGEFTINITDAGKILAGKKLCPGFTWLNNHVELVPDAVTMVSGGARAEEKILKVVVLDNDWTYIRNGYGVILSREINGKAIGQNTVNKLCYEIDVKFFQENISSGGSKYGSTTYSRTGELEDNNGFTIECTK